MIKNVNIHLNSRRGIRMPVTVENLSEEELVKAVKKMLLANELENNDRVIYMISHAKKGKSGYSFGLCQHDCAATSGARKFIIRLLVDSGISGDEVSRIDSILGQRKPKLSLEQTQRINAVLRSSQSQIAELDNNTISRSISHIYGLVSDLSGSTGARVREAILSDSHAFLTLVDYHNQFGFSKGKQMHKFLGGSFLVRDRAINLDAPVLLEIRRYINEGTFYAVANLGDCLRRQRHIDSLSLLDITANPNHDIEAVVEPVPERNPLIHLAPVSTAPHSTLFSFVPPPPPAPPPVQVSIIPDTVAGSPAGGVRATHTASGVSGGLAVSGNGDFEIKIAIPIPCSIM